MATTITDNFQLNASLALDNKYGIFTGSVWRPYNDVTEANTTIVSSYRYIGLTVSVLLNGVPTEYWYIGGTADANLILKLKFNTTEFLPEWFGAVGDGVTDDTPAISAAIIAAANNTLIFTGGKTYMVSTLTISAQLSIGGNGTIKKIASTTAAPVITINSANVNITDINIDGNKSSFTISPVSGLTANYGIFSTLQENILIQKVYIKNTYSEGIRIECCKNVNILNCHIENCQQTSAVYSNAAGIYVRASLPTGGPYESSNIVISNCFIDQQLSLNSCIKIHAAAGNVMSKVKVINNNCLMGELLNIALGIECYDGASSNATIKDVIIEGNTIECTGSGTTNYFAFGISIGSQSSSADYGIAGVIISSNIIRTCRRLGIEVIGNYITVIGNEIIDSGEISVNADSIYGGMMGVKITGNTTRHIGGNSAYFGGVRIQATLNNMYGTLIEGNIFDGVAGINSTEDIIYIKAGNGTGSNTGKIYNLSIVDNHVLEIRRNGINIDNSVNIENLKISGNLFKYADSGQINFYCIYSGAISVKNLTITNNTFVCYINSTSKGNGVKFNAFGTYENVILSGNIFSNASTGIVLAQLVDGLIISNNIFDSNTSGVVLTQVVDGMIISQNIFDSNTSPLQLTAADVNVIAKDNVIKGGTNTINSSITYLDPLYNATSTAFTSATLNSAYPLALIGQTVVCTTLNLIYEKVTSTGWVSYATTNV
jgi:hypothetical protein